MSLYMPVKYALLIILTVGLVMTIINLLPELQRGRANTQGTIIMILQLIIIVIGLAGSWRDNRQLLVTFAIILTVLVIVAVVNSQQFMVVGNAVLDIVCIVLALYQSEMLRSGRL